MKNSTVDSDTKRTGVEAPNGGDSDDPKSGLDEDNSDHSSAFSEDNNEDLIGMQDHPEVLAKAMQAEVFQLVFSMSCLFSHYTTYRLLVG